MIQNEAFWRYWRAGQFDEALRCQLTAEPQRRGAALFGRSQTTTIAGLSAGEFLYNYLMIDPTVVVGLDFARAEDLSTLFQLSRFAETVDTTTIAGDMAQLQGYVAEQMIAQELAAAGYDVQFPQTSNQAGWDLLVDNQPFQVKCAQSKQVVEAHFERYPDIPVLVNAELGSYYENHPLVMTTSVTREQVLADTKKTLAHAEDLLDFQIPWITASVSAFANVRRVQRDGILLTTAARNVVSDTASRTALAAAGKAVLGATGALIMPGAGAIVFPVIGAYVGMAQGGKLSSALKRQFARKEEAALCTALVQLIDQMLAVLTVKEEIKQSKWMLLKTELPVQVEQALFSEHTARLKLLQNCVRELELIRGTVTQQPIRAFERIVSVLGKAGIHVFTLRAELKCIEEALLAYKRKL